MEGVVRYLQGNKTKGLVVLMVVNLLLVLLVARAGFLVGIVSIYVLYFALCTYVFTHLSPRRWEVNMIFFLYICASVVLILGFTGVSLFNNVLFSIPEQETFALSFWKHFYFSAAMFTSLGFSDYQPATTEAQFFVVAQSLLGGAHSVTFISIILMHSNWTLKPEERSGLPGLDGSLKQQLRLIEQIPQMVLMLKVVVGLLLLILLALLVLVFS
ncbi:ion channel [Ectopseudomonas guguanensis]|uniref:ion channel n=1 Tax=Ectopseudomonas guguanensis TaxID=1198456 RepID=UPI0028A6B9EF|nr:ion channel [Pseudomonas guguanensis]